MGHHVIHTAVVSASVHINLYHFPDITNTNKIFFSNPGEKRIVSITSKSTANIQGFAHTYTTWKWLCKCTPSFSIYKTNYDFEKYKL